MGEAEGTAGEERGGKGREGKGEGYNDTSFSALGAVVSVVFVVFLL